MKILTLIIAILTIPAALGYTMQHNITHTWSEGYNHSYDRNSTLTCWDPQTNSTNTTTVSHQGILTGTLSETFVHNDTTILYPTAYGLENSDGSVKLWMNNTNKSYTFSVEERRPEYITARFTSEFETADVMVLSMNGANRTYEVYRNTTMIFPYEWNSSYTNTTTMNWRVVTANLSGNASFSVTGDAPLTVFLDHSLSRVKIGTYVQSVIYSVGRTRVSDVVLSSDQNLTYTKYEVKDGYVVNYIPLSFGVYHLNYTVTGDNGNKTFLSRIVHVEPEQEIYFRDINIPSLRVGDIAKFPIYEGSAQKFNFTLAYANYEVTEMNESNSSNSTYPDFEIFMSDGNGASFFLPQNETIQVIRDKLFLNVKLNREGVLNARVRVDPPPVILISNPEFFLRSKSGNVSVFENQTFNVNGRETTCELDKTSSMYDPMRVCKVSFPFSSSLSNDLVMMTKQDFDQYEHNHAQELSYQQYVAAQNYEKANTYRWIFFYLSIVLVVIAFIVWYPWDWLAFPS